MNARPRDDDDQRYEAREDLVLSTKPHVDFYIEDDPDEPPVGIAVKNAGPGPATMKSVTFFVDKKVVKDTDKIGITDAKLPTLNLSIPNSTPSILWLQEKRSE